jgi:two-component system, cell cycle sensor histidine kinase and response regulator CckA
VKIVITAPTAPTAFDPRPNVMIVDDEEMICTLLRTFLETHGYHPIVRTSSDVAIEMCDSDVRQLDLLITDVRMPGTSGPVLAKEFRVVHPDLPVIFISGYVGDAIMDSPESPNTLFVHKPFKLPKLLAAVQSLLEESGVY